MSALVNRALARLARALRAQPRHLAYPVRGDRLELRPFAESDAQAVRLYRSDAEVLRHLARTRPYDPAETLEKLRRRRDATRKFPRDRCFLAIVRREDGALIGECSLIRPFFEDVHYLGFLLRRDAWGRGYATEVARAMLEFGFAHLSVHRVLAGCLSDNLASIRVLTKIGLAAKAPRTDFFGAPPGLSSCVFETTARTWPPCRISTVSNTSSEYSL